jgi:cell division protein FtsQ
MWNDHRLLNRIAATLCTLAALVLLYAAIVLVLRSALFPLREVRVTAPVQHTTREQLDAIVTRELRGNFFTLDLDSARAALGKLPWVRNARLRRVWPHTLEVAIEEHVALARWGDVALVNTHGELFEAASAGRLPLFSGPEGTQAEIRERYAAFRAALAAIGREPVEVNLSNRRAWQIKLDDGNVLELGRADPLPRLVRFVEMYPRIAAQLPLQARRIDLRYANGFAVRVPGLRWSQLGARA